jgi:linoleoyl-CoA desaturase
MTQVQPKGKIKFVPRENKMFFVTLKSRVDDYFKESGISQHANANMVIKTISLFAIYLLPFFALLLVPMSSGAALVMWLIMGIGMAGIGMGVMHDANHGAYSNNDVVNRIMSFSLNLLGASIFNWKFQHNLLHHTYTNITHMDDDIEDKAILRFSPHTQLKSVHRFQWIYAFAFYSITSLYWILLKDFVQFVKYIRNGVNQKSKAENTVAFVKILIIKACYFSVVFGLPVWVAGYSFGFTILGFLVMHAISGIILTVVFQLAHTVEETSHPMPDANGNIENEWAIHQMNTTVDFSPGNKWLSWYLGGLNYQVEHHLFPRICHVHYPTISKIVQNTAQEFGVPYLVNETFGQALRSHIATLRRFGRLPNLEEAIG